MNWEEKCHYLMNYKRSKLHSELKDSRKVKIQLNMAEEGIDINTKPRKAAKDGLNYAQTHVRNVRHGDANARKARFNEKRVT